MNSRRGANEYSQTAYFIWNLLWLQVGMLLYGDYLLDEVKLGPLELNYSQSFRCFVALMGVFAFIGILSAWNNRTAFQIAANVLLPMEIYTVLSCLERWHPAVRVLFAAACGVIVWYLAAFFRSRKRIPLRKRLRLAYLSGRVAAALFLSVFLALSLPALLPAEKGAVPASMDFADDEVWTLEAQAETIGMLRDSVWEELDTKERLEVLQTVANVECAYLGLPYMPQVAAAECRDDILGQYDYAERTIVFNLSHLPHKNGPEMLNALLHECQHAYQFACVEIYQAAGEEYRDLTGFRVFWQAEKWREEFLDYEDGSSGTEEDDAAYRSQACETDAREGAEREMEKYLEYLGY